MDNRWYNKQEQRVRDFENIINCTGRGFFSSNRNWLNMCHKAKRKKPYASSLSNILLSTL